MPEGRKLTLAAVAPQFKQLEGEVLTVIDAAIPLFEQKKAIKDLIRARFADRQRYLEGVCLDGWTEGEESTVIDSGTPPKWKGHSTDSGSGVTAGSFART